MGRLNFPVPEPSAKRNTRVDFDKILFIEYCDTHLPFPCGLQGFSVAHN